MYDNMYTIDEDNSKYSFEWDENKNLLNIQKHGVSFVEVAYALLDDGKIEHYDEKHSNYENRWICIGVFDRHITVSYTIRINTIRIISARPSNRKERKLYYGKNSSL